jgi:hypothetical protein
LRLLSKTGRLVWSVTNLAFLKVRRVIHQLKQEFPTWGKPN